MKVLRGSVNMFDLCVIGTQTCSSLVVETIMGFYENNGTSFVHRRYISTKRKHSNLFILYSIQVILHYAFECRSIVHNCVSRMKI